jgi:hypothetical protein
MQAKNLLVITNNFPDKETKYVGNVFVKEQVKYLKDYFENVYVVSPAAYGIEYLRKTSFVLFLWARFLGLLREKGDT